MNDSFFATQTWRTGGHHKDIGISYVTVPGISYMARGGYHWEKDGKVLMDEEPGAKLVKEPPHWMMMWPFDSTTSKLPTPPNPAGVWIMFDGSPFAHLMVYQDPN
jgi:hypothetical protein